MCWVHFFPSSLCPRLFIYEGLSHWYFQNFLVCVQLFIYEGLSRWYFQNFLVCVHSYWFTNVCHAAIFRTTPWSTRPLVPCLCPQLFIYECLSCWYFQNFLVGVHSYLFTNVCHAGIFRTSLFVSTVIYLRMSVMLVFSELPCWCPQLFIYEGLSRWYFQNILVGVHSYLFTKVCHGGIFRTSLLVSTVIYLRMSVMLVFSELPCLCPVIYLRRSVTVVFSELPCLCPQLLIYECLSCWYFQNFLVGVHSYLFTNVCHGGIFRTSLFVSTVIYLRMSVMLVFSELPCLCPQLLIYEGLSRWYFQNFLVGVHSYLFTNVCRAAIFRTSLFVSTVIDLRRSVTLVFSEHPCWCPQLFIYDCLSCCYFQNFLVCVHSYLFTNVCHGAIFRTTSWSTRPRASSLWRRGSRGWSTTTTNCASRTWPSPTTASTCARPSTRGEPTASRLCLMEPVSWAGRGRWQGVSVSLSLLGALTPYSRK